jgi:asparagine synthase (glutamine-hydrolysing)
MAGFLLAWTRPGQVPEAATWARSLLWAGRQGLTPSSLQRGRVAMSAWHRKTGEFPRSGKITTSQGKQVVFIGQCLGALVDASDIAIQKIASPDRRDAELAQLNGPFCAAMVDEASQEVQVLTDRHRHYPLYVYRDGNVTVASTDIQCLVPWLPQLALDMASVDMLLRCGELIDRMTLLQGVELLPPGTVLTDSGNGPSERRYWAMRHDGAESGTFDATADALAGHLKEAVRRIERASPKLGITLSGGLDSRIILDLCKNPERIPSFTWGLPGCRDIACATQYAQLVGSPHTVRHWEPETFPPVWPLGADVTVGSFGIDSMHMMPFVPLLGSACDVVLNGLAGDAILGGNFLQRSWLAEGSIHNLAKACWRWRVTEAEDALATQLLPYTPTQPHDGAQQRWVESIASRDGGARPVERLNDWLYENRVFRNTNSGTMLLRSGVESHAPFFDRDFVDAVTKVRQEDKVKHRLYLAVMQRAAPRAASVTWQRTQLPPSWGYHANLASMAAHRAINKITGVFGVDPFKAMKVADPAAWLRGPWRSVAHDLLLGPRAKQRRLIHPQALQKLWESHLSGANHTRQIGVLIGIELFARQVLDGDGAGVSHA